MDVPNVPITTLAGVTSLTEMLPEMSQHFPLLHTICNKSLLFHPRVAEEAQHLLGVRNVNLAPQLINSLEQVTTVHVDVKDVFVSKFGSDNSLQQPMPELLREILDTEPNIFDDVPLYVRDLTWATARTASRHSVPVSCEQVLVSDNSITSTTQSNPPSPSCLQTSRGQADGPPCTLSEHIFDNEGSGKYNDNHVAITGRINSSQDSNCSVVESSMQFNSQASNEILNEHSSTAQLSDFLAEKLSLIPDTTQMHMPDDVTCELQTICGNPNVNNSIVDLCTSSSENKEYFHGSREFPIETSRYLPDNKGFSMESRKFPVDRKSVIDEQFSLTDRNFVLDSRNFTLPNREFSLNQTENRDSLYANSDKAMETYKNNLGSILSVPIEINTISNDINVDTTVIQTFVRKNVQDSIETKINMENPDEIQTNVKDSAVINTSLVEKVEAADEISVSLVETKAEISQNIQNAMDVLGHKENLNDVDKTVAACHIEPELNESVNRETLQVKHSLKEPYVKLQRMHIDILHKNHPNDENQPSKSALGKRQRNSKSVQENSDIELNDDGDDEYNTDIFSPTKKKCGGSTKDRPEPEIIIKPKLRRVEKEFVPVLEKLTFEELMEKNMYAKFLKTADIVINSISVEDLPELTEDCMIQEEHLLSRTILQSFVMETAKLKSLGATETIPKDKLIRVLTIMDLNIRGGDRVSPITDEDNENIRQMWMETTMERVLGAADASLVSLYIMTSPNMPKRVYIDDIIDRVVLFIKYQLHNTIFPSYDSTYSLNNKKKDGRKKKSTNLAEKNIVLLFNKISELVGLLSELFTFQVVQDTIVLHASSVGVAPFFVENVSSLQLAALKLVTTIFTMYTNHRRILLDDILASIARLPNTKRNLRTYRLNSEESIQMLTALVLQLIQCVVALPENLTNENVLDHENPRKIDLDVLICNKFDTATKTAAMFLTVFLNKCGSKTEEIDYRPLFENFIQDLLTTFNKPEWPATELLLTLLGKMLVSNFSNKGTDTSLRLACIDYLGVVASRLIKNKVASQTKLSTITNIIKDIQSEERKESNKKRSQNTPNFENEEDRIYFLQSVLLDFLAVDAQTNTAFQHARHFYIAQWYKETSNEKLRIASGNSKHTKKHNRKSKHNKEDELDSEIEEDIDEEPKTNQQNADKYRAIQERKDFLVKKIRPFKQSAGTQVLVYQTYVDYSGAEFIAQYLASKRNFGQSFDTYLKSILIVLRETSIAVRTKALKCLTTIVESDSSVLGRRDMQIGVHHSFLDHATSVREAAVDLVGKFVLSQPELISKYYEMLSARILDTGVSVRKRVIKILKDICIARPDFEKVPEICVKMIRRVNDEEGIRKLVMEVFQNMWFTPTKDTSLLRKVINITDVVASSKDIGLEWFEQLLISLLKPKEDKENPTKIQTDPPKVLLFACKQIVDCLIENVLRLEESNNDGSGSSQRLIACLMTLHLFAKIKPELLIKHASTLQPYLSLKCQTIGDIQIISNVARMLELVVPLIEHPSETFLAQLEEDTMKLILQYDRVIVASCLSCLGSVVNNVTRNFKLVRDCFKKYYDFLALIKMRLMDNQKTVIEDVRWRPYFKRAICIVGLLLRHFDFKDPEILGDLPINVTELVFDIFSYFLQQNNHDMQSNALKAIGSICVRHFEFMLNNNLKVFYHKMLIGEDVPLAMKSEVLLNIELYLLEEDKRMLQQEMEWSKLSKQENLKEMGDVSSGMASAVIQHYLKEILQSYVHPEILIRQPALRVIQLVLQQGLVHPVQIVPYLICMSTDCEKMISHSADVQLLELEKKYPGFIHTKSSLGIKLSFQLQKILQEDSIVRGFRIKEHGEHPSALNGYLYSVLRNSRQQRRALVLNMLKQFDEQVHISLAYMLYLCDNLAYFPYLVQDESLFIIHHIDVMISFSGTNLLQSFREGLIMTEAQRQALDINQMSALDEEDEDESTLLTRVPEDTSHLQACLTAAQGCLLLLILKQHLKDTYGLGESKIQQYSPSEPAKVYEKTAPRKSNTLFNPQRIINKLKEGMPLTHLNEEGRKDLINQYLDFKQLMLRLDPDDPDEEDNKTLSVSISAGNNTTALSSEMIPDPSTSIDQTNNVTCKGQQTPKVPKLIISRRRIHTSSRNPKNTEKTKKLKPKKKKRKFVSSGEDSETDCSDPDFMA